MNQTADATTPRALCLLLWQTTGEQEACENEARAFLDAQTRAPTSCEEALRLTNEWRALNHWPLASSMSLFNPKLAAYDTEGLEVSALRQHWQQGLIPLLKGDVQSGLVQLDKTLLEAMKLPEQHIVTQTALVLQNALGIYTKLASPHGLNQALQRFDILLRETSADKIHMMPAELLLRDCLFYASLQPDKNITTQFALDEAFKSHTEFEDSLNARLRFAARNLAKALQPPDGDTKIAKAKILPLILPVMDALLFLKQFHMRGKLEMRLKEIDENMLLIAVPVQKLMGECLRLAV